MMKIDFYFDFISPFSYLAAMNIAEFGYAHGIQTHGAQIQWMPINLPSLIRISDNIPPSHTPNKARYLVRDLKRKAKKMALPLKLILPGTFDSRNAMYVACMLNNEDRQRFCLTVLKNIWSGDVAVSNPDWLRDIVVKEKLPEKWLLYNTETAKNMLRANTDRAFAAGAFGAPSFVLHKSGRRELFFGVDHMPDLAAACAAKNDG
ncbi:MAG: DsbA family protein [Mariprofundaceae bacterium]|nr:DsbA family protein [Mariprofundaceae bacterium]